MAGRLGAPWGASAHQELPLKHSWRMGCELWRLAHPWLLGAGADPGPAFCPHSADRVCLGAQRLQQAPAESSTSVLMMWATSLLCMHRATSRAAFQHMHHHGASHEVCCHTQCSTAQAPVRAAPLLMHHPVPSHSVCLCAWCCQQMPQQSSATAPGLAALTVPAFLLTVCCMYQRVACPKVSTLASRL